MRHSLWLLAAAGGLGFVFAAHAETVALSAGDCKKLVQHAPNDTVTYKPGVDVRGKAVVPADVGGGYKLDLPESIDINIGIDLADRLGLRNSRRPGAPPGAPVRKVTPFEGRAALGTLSIRGTDAYWNGQRIAPQDEVLLAEACRQGLSAAGVAVPEPTPAAPEPR